MNTLHLSRRHWLQLTVAALAGSSPSACLFADDRRPRDLRIRELRVTPVALPDPPILAASGCHGPYFLRSIIELVTEDGLVGIGETYGSSNALKQLHQSRQRIVGKSAWAYRELATVLADFHPGIYAAIEMACLDAIGKATGRRVCDLVGGPVRDEVEFAAYLFYRYAADDARALGDPRLVDQRGTGDRALDLWGEVRNAESMSKMAAAFRDRWGFRVLKLKAGVLDPQEELRTMEMMYERFGEQVPLRIDPNARWTLPTAIRIGNDLRELPLEYYEDPVAGQRGMADVRAQTGLTVSTNSCVSRWRHLKSAVHVQPVDVVLGDIYWFGGITGWQTLGRVTDSLGWGLGYHSNNHAGICMSAMIHATASTPYLTHAPDTHYVWLVPGADIIEGENLPIKDGKMTIPAGAGLGVTIDHDKLARAHEVYQKSGMRDRVDSQTMQRFEPGWRRQLY